jgi:RHS repeat-associated protein
MPDYEPWDGGSSSGCGLKPPAISNTYDFTVTHPSGAVGTFHFSNTRHFRAGIHASECLLSSDQQNGTYYYSYHLHTPNYFDVMSLLTKTITGPGLVQPMVWSYDYGITQQSLWGSSGQAADYPCTTCPTEKLVTVVQPDSTQVQYRYGFLYALNEGRLLGSSVLDAAGVVKKVDTTTYMTEAEAATPQNFFPRYGFIINGDDPSTAQIRPVTRQTIQQDGVTFTMLVNQGCGGTTVYCFDLYGNTTNATRSSTLGYSKTESTTYSHQTTSWVLGQVATVTCIAPASCANVVESKTDYDLASALPIRIYGPGTTAVPGKLQQTLTYNTDGTVATAKDGNNHTTTLANWKRGTPQAITYADGASVAANVDDNGWLTWIEDENDYRTCYGYDGLGRMASVTYPSETALHVCDTSTWNPTTSVFVSVAIPEYGLPANHWRQTVSTGNGRKVTYYDAMWRPVVQEQYDTANVTGTRSVSVKRYDVDGHPAYQSYPLASLTDYAALTVGTRSYYDALDRVTEVQQDSELGVLNTTTEYLTGFQTRVTNPRGFQTTTNYMAYDLPSTDWPVNVTMPETAVTKISRDAFGKPRAMTRKNAAGTLAVTRTYVYDDFQQLCKRIEPETSATLMEYDNAGNLAWSASGQAWMADTCDRSNVLASNRSNRVYDTRSRLINLMFPDGVGDQVWSYTPDGLTDQIVTFNSIDQGTAVTNAYHYNRRRMLNGQGESVHQQDWYTNGIGYGYDANGHLSVHTYPSGQSVAYAPNALGQATQAGSYATGVSYFPNGAIKQFTYGNGIVHTLTQNIRQLPDTSRDAYGAVETLDDGYDYDPNGNVAAISDGLATSAGRGNRTMSYDGLDRLTATISPMFASGTSYSYDTLDNLVRVKAPGRDHTYLYDSKWQLTNVTNTGSGVSVIGLGYDPQGNLSNKNGVPYDFDLGNRLRSVTPATGKQIYRYDGHGRRVSIASNRGNLIYQYSTRGQLMYQRDRRTGTDTRTDYISLGGSLVAEREQDVPTLAVTIRYQHTDALGSPVAVTNAAHAVIETSEFEPYGLLLNRALTDGPGYTGHVSDAATGLSYMQQRYYDPGIGRFLSIDPVTANSSTGSNFNRYWYANNNPYKFTDPDGRLGSCAGGSSKCHGGVVSYAVRSIGPAAPVDSSEGHLPSSASIRTEMKDQKTIFTVDGTVAGEWTSKNDVSKRSLPGANDPYESSDSYPTNGPYKNKTNAYGPNDILKTDDVRGRWLHGGGTGLPNPSAPEQGWKPTMGCTRMQNKDIQELVNRVRDFKSAFPGTSVPYSRVNE